MAVIKSSYELINYHGGLPLKMFIHNINYTMYHWHKDIELVFVLDGEARFFVENQNYLLSQNDILLINSNTLHSSEYEKPNLILVLQIDPQYFENYYRGFSNILFDCKSVGLVKTDKYDDIRKLLAEMMLVINRKQEAYYIRIQQLLFELILLLLKRHKRNELTNSKTIIKDNEQLSRIIKYIDENYKNNITLSDLASLVYMNESYFSSYFKKNIGISLTKYLAAMRLQNSIKDLLSKDKNINEIALSNGFPNEKSYFKVFKQRYGITPTQFRKKTIGNEDSHSYSNNEEFNYFNYSKTKAFEKLLSFTKREKGIRKVSKNENDELDTELKEINVNVTHISGRLKRSWSKLMTFGRAAEGLRGEWQKQLREVQKDIPFEYIRFHGIFSDDMMVYHIDEEGKPVYNFRLIDQLIDFFMEVNLKPFVEIGFMPNDLASNKEQTIFWWNANVSYPKDMSRWVDLVKRFLIHCIDRYGLQEVRKWYFEIWNEPDLKDAFWYGNDEMFFQLFKETFTAIKEIDPMLKTGGCGATSGIPKWNMKLMDFCLENNLTIDFISIHPYPIELTNKSQNQFFYKGKQVGKYTLADKDFIIKTVKQLREQLKMKGLNNLEIHITEFNSNVQWDYVNDTMFKAPFLVKNVLENNNLVASLGYWAFTDIFEERWMSPHIFHGGFGFITNNGLKKPIYHAYKLLNKLGEEIISKNDEYIITKKGSDYQVLIFNYHHFDSLYKNSDESHMSYLDRYEVFEHPHRKIVKLILNGLNGNYRINTYRLNRNHGSIFDQWLKMGAVEEMTKKELDYLEAISKMELSIKYVNIDNTFTDKIQLEPHEVQLIEFNRIIK